MLLVVEWLGLLLVVPGSVEAGSAASSAPGSDDPVDGSEPLVLQPPSTGLKPRSPAATGALRQEEVDSLVLAVCE